MNPSCIAVVDDDVDICDMIADVLTDSGYPVVCYPDGERFLDEVAQGQPMLLILDVQLASRTSGWDMLQQLRSRPTTSAMPIILSTADARFVQQHSDQIQALGARVLEKPFDIDILLNTVAQALQGTRS